MMLPNAPEWDRGAPEHLLRSEVGKPSNQYYILVYIKLSTPQHLKSALNSKGWVK